jgi:hypothetical protein
MFKVEPNQFLLQFIVIYILRVVRLLWTEFWVKEKKKERKGKRKKKERCCIIIHFLFKMWRHLWTVSESSKQSKMYCFYVFVTYKVYSWNLQPSFAKCESCVPQKHWLARLGHTKTRGLLAHVLTWPSLRSKNGYKFLFCIKADAHEAREWVQLQLL